VSGEGRAQDNQRTSKWTPSNQVSVVKPIRLSKHARIRAIQRGATEEEVVACIRQSSAVPAEAGKFSVRKEFLYESVSPMNNEYYRFKTVEPIFVVEPDEIVVVTVKVYYSNEEANP
jgi:hypothetical protein